MNWNQTSFPMLIMSSAMLFIFLRPQTLTFDTQSIPILLHKMAFQLLWLLFIVSAILFKPFIFPISNENMTKTKYNMLL